VGTLLLGIVLGSLVALPVGAAPNVLVVLADDQPWNGTSLGDLPNGYGYETPQLERLAAAGVTYTNAYSPGPACRVTRAAMLTGRNPAERGQTHWMDVHLAAIEQTLPEAIKAFDPDYVTGHFGKWHLDDDPGVHGFDSWGEALLDGGDDPTGGATDRGPPGDPKGVDAITDAAIRFIEDRAQDERPFYLQIWHYAIHTPHVDGVQGDARTLDGGLGRVLDALESLGLSASTYVVYTSDNGGAQSGSVDNAPLRGGKGTAWEGGIRVPWVMRGPGLPTGTVSAEVITGCDLFGLVLSWIGAGSRAPVARVWRVPRRFPGEIAHTAYRSGRWKLRREPGSAPQLFDLLVDSGETTDLSLAETTVAAAMEAELDAYERAVNAPPHPAPPPDRSSCGLGAELAPLALALWAWQGARRRARVPGRP
jgi:arylsulfatase A